MDQYYKDSLVFLVVSEDDQLGIKALKITDKQARTREVVKMMPFVLA
jgi:hypothetical protein